MERVETQIRELMGPLDPMRDQPARSAPPSPVASMAVVHRQRPLVPRWSMAGAAAIVVAAGLMVWNSAGPNVPRGVAVTPSPLVIVAPANPTPAAELLSDLAGKAAASDVPKQTGATEYLEMRNWYLHSQVSSSNTVSVVVPEIRKLWRAPDGSGRTDRAAGEPEFRSEQDREDWAADIGGTDTHKWGAGERLVFAGGRPPTDPAALARWLHRENPPDSIGPIKTYVAITDLLRERVLLPAERAAVLRLLSELPGMAYQGQTHDRSGRPALAFSMDSAHGGLPTRYTLLVSPDSGLILGNEQMLTASAGALNVTVPAVIEYETYLRAEYE